MLLEQFEKIQFWSPGQDVSPPSGDGIPREHLPSLRLIDFRWADLALGTIWKRTGLKCSFAGLREDLKIIIPGLYHKEKV
jgi:hypothetical protein